MQMVQKDLQTQMQSGQLSQQQAEALLAQKVGEILGALWKVRLLCQLFYRTWALCLLACDAAHGACARPPGAQPYGAALVCQLAPVAPVSLAIAFVPLQVNVLDITVTSGACLASYICK
jgi:hypothetical protein